MDELKKLIFEMRKIASKVGSLHSWWDIISDMEQFINDKPTIIKMTKREWTNYAMKLLKIKKIK